MNKNKIENNSYYYYYGVWTYPNRELGKERHRIIVQRGRGWSVYRKWEGEVINCVYCFRGRGREVVGSVACRGA